MAIEVRRVSLEARAPVGPNPIQTVTFSGASYHENRRLVINAARMTLGSHPVMLVRFTTPSSDGNGGSNSAEFPGAVGQAIAAALLKREGVQLDPGAAYLFSRIFGAETDRETGIGVAFTDGELSFPPSTNIDIETKLDIGR